MTTVLWLLFVIGLLGAFDTFYYHEWRARLPALGREARAELRLHATRNTIYAVIFGTLPWFAWHGVWTVALGLLFVCEIAVTISDFIVEDDVRKSLGGVFPGERATHTIIGITYGAMLGHLVPVLYVWWNLPTDFVPAPPAIPEPLRWFMVIMAPGLLLFAIRDLYASAGLSGGGWPWNREIAS